MRKIKVNSIHKNLYNELKMILVKIGEPLNILQNRSIIISHYYYFLNSKVK